MGQHGLDRCVFRLLLDRVGSYTLHLPAVYLFCLCSSTPHFSLPFSLCLLPLQLSISTQSSQLFGGVLAKSPFLLLFKLPPYTKVPIYLHAMNLTQALLSQTITRQGSG